MKDYIVKSLNGMAIGLFSSLIIGLILKQIGLLIRSEQVIMFGQYAQYMMGPAIAASTAFSVGASPLAVFAAMTAGAIGAGTLSFNEGVAMVKVGEPVGAFITGVVAAELSRLIQGRTKLDIILVPVVAIVAGGFTGIFISPPIAQVMSFIGSFINKATELEPFFMGVILSVVMGIILTLPISSAAIAISLGISGLAGGASLVGCCCQMVGFAVISYADNGFGGSIAQGIGTSMLQVPNIIKKPVIWLPPIISSAILGPVSTMIFKIESSPIGAGMGTSGLVGQLGAWQAMSEHVSKPYFFTAIILMNFLLPAIITYIVYLPMKKKGLIVSGDMKIGAK